MKLEKSLRNGKLSHYYLSISPKLTNFTKIFKFPKKLSNFGRYLEESTTFRDFPTQKFRAFRFLQPLFSTTWKPSKPRIVERKVIFVPAKNFENSRKYKLKQKKNKRYETYRKLCLKYKPDDNWSTNPISANPPANYRQTWSHLMHDC